jgi:hypothetical protein
MNVACQQAYQHKQQDVAKIHERDSKITLIGKDQSGHRNCRRETPKVEI